MGRLFGSKNALKTRCKHGHKQGQGSRYKSGQCKACSIDYSLQYALEHPEERLKAVTDWKNKNRQHVARYTKKYCRKWYLNKNGWSLERIAIALVAQNNKCAICDKKFTKKDPPCCDHEHTTPQRPRGLLHS